MRNTFCKFVLVSFLALVGLAGQVVAQPFTFTQWNCNTAWNTASGTLTDNLDGSYVMVAGGNEIWGGSDSGVYAYTMVTGDFDARVRITDSSTGPSTYSDWSRVGLMARVSADCNAAHVFVHKSPRSDNLHSAQWRDAAGANTGNRGYNGYDETWPENYQRILRHGQVFELFYRTKATLNGNPVWSHFYRLKVDDLANSLQFGNAGGWQNTTYPDTIALGVAGCSHNGINYQLVTNKFDNYTVNNTYPAYSVRPIHYHLYADRGDLNEFQNLVNSPATSWGEVQDSLENPAAMSNFDDMNHMNTVAGSLREDNDNCTQMYGVFVAPATDNYTFYLASDDDSRLFMSNDEQPTGKTQVTARGGWCPYRGYPGDSTYTVHLNAGEKRYIEAIMHQGGGGGHVEVAASSTVAGWTVLTDGSTPGIPAANFLPCGKYANHTWFTVGDVAITQQPANLSIIAGRTGTFSLKLDGTPPWTVQWQIKKASDADFSNYGTASASVWNYTLAAGEADCSFDQAQFRAVVTGPNNSAISDPATLTVTADTTPAVASSVTSDMFVTNVFVHFTGNQVGLDPATAENPANYTLTDDASTLTLTVYSATLVDAFTVHLVTDPMADGTFHTVADSGLLDRCGTPVTAGGVTFESWKVSPMFVRWDVWLNIGGTTIGDLTGNANYPFNPSETFYYPTTVSPFDLGDNYGSRFYGYFVPPASGDYEFALQNDDDAAFFIASAATPELLPSGATFAVGCCNGGWSAASPPQVGLVAGQRYKFMVLQKEGGGDDYIRLGFRPYVAPPDPNPYAFNFLSGLSLESWGNPNTVTASISGQPADYTGNAGVPLNFTVTAANNGGFGMYYQWFSNSLANPGWTAIPGANAATYNIPVAPYDASLYPGDTVLQFQAWVTGPGFWMTSRVATATLSVDIVPPMVTAALVDPFGTNVYVTFSEPIDANTLSPVADLANFGLYVDAGGGTTGDQIPVLGLFPLDATHAVMPLNLEQTGPLPAGNYLVYIAHITDKAFPTENEIADGFVLYPLTATVPLAGPLGVVQDDFWNNLGNLPDANNLNSLQGNANWPYNPSTMSMVPQPTTGGNGGNSNPALGDQYALRFAGHLLPTVSGNYMFGMAHDDGAWMYLSTTPEPANLVQIGAFGCCAGGIPGSTMGPIHLDAGKAYYFEAYVEEGGGGDYLDVSWQPPGAPGYSIIPSANVAFLANVLFPSPVPSVTVIEHSPVTFAPVIQLHGAAAAAGEAVYQWSASIDGGHSWNNIDGATNATYTIPVVSLNQAGNQFMLTVGINRSTPPLFWQTTTTLNVDPDIVPPFVVSAAQHFDGTIYVVFSEPILGVDIGNINNYVLDTGNVTAVAVSADAKTAVLTATGLPTGLGVRSVGLHVSEMHDLSNNVLDPNPTYVQVGLWDVVNLGLVRYEWFTGIGGNCVQDMWNSAAWQNNRPNMLEYSNTVFWNASIGDTGTVNNNSGMDNYGLKVSGWLLPPTDGNYTFETYTDDSGVIFVSSDQDPINQIEAAAVSFPACGCCFIGGPLHTYAFKAGQAYYFESYVKEGGGGDFMRPKWNINGAGMSIIPPSALMVGINPSLMLKFTNQPVNASVQVGRLATFHAGAFCTEGGTEYQWQKNTGSGFVDIPGATGPSYTTPPLTAGDFGNVYHCVASNYVATDTIDINGNKATVLGDVPLGPVASADVMAVVNPAPYAIMASSPAPFDKVYVTFDTDMDPATALDVNNYILNNSVLVTAAAFAPGGQKVVVLTTDVTLSQGVPYVLTVQNVLDGTGTYAIQPSPANLNFTPAIYEPGVLVELYSGGNGTGVGVLTSLPNYPNLPDQIHFMPRFDWDFGGANDYQDQYGCRLSALFVPPQTGIYTFFIRADDGLALYLNYGSVVPDTTDPAGAVQIVAGPADGSGCCTCYDRYYGTVSVPLVAGQKYYTYALFREGGGGDWFAMTYVMNWSGPPNWPACNGGVDASHFLTPTYVPKPTDPKVKLEIYYGGGGGAVSDLLAQPNYPNTPDEVHYLPTMGWDYHNSRNYRDSYGARLTALYVPPADGNYKFFIRHDDGAQLFLNPNGTDPAGKVMIIDQGGGGNGSYATGASAATYPLTGGQSYYLEALLKEGGGGDYIVVAATSDGTVPPDNNDDATVIPASMLQAPPPAATVRPTLVGAAGTATYVNVGLSKHISSEALDPAAWTILDTANAPAATVNSVEAIGMTSVRLHLSSLLTVGGAYKVVGTATLSGAYWLGVTDTDGLPIAWNLASGLDPLAGGVTKATNLFGVFATDPGTPTVQPVALPTDAMLPLASLTEQGFDGREVRPSGGCPYDFNSTTNYELVLAGATLWQGDNRAAWPCFIEPGIINYNHNNEPNYGHITPDKAFPGYLRSDSIDNIAFEFVAYVELQPGFYRWGVNSDDGFEVLCLTTPAAFGNQTGVKLGEWNGGRGTSDTTFDIVVTQAGLYPIRMIYGQGGGGANVEFWNYGLSSGAYVAINDPAGLKAWRTPLLSVPADPSQPTVGIQSEVENAYNGTADTGGVVVGGQYAFIHMSTNYTNSAGVPGYVTSTVNLGNFAAADSIQIELLGSWDWGYVPSTPGWEVLGGSVTTPLGSQAIDFSVSDQGFTVFNSVPPPTNTPAGTGPWVYTGTSWSANGDGTTGIPTWSALRSPALPVGANGPVSISLAHRWNFEADGATTGWDGGQIRISVNGGAFTAVPVSAFTGALQPGGRLIVSWNDGVPCMQDWILQGTTNLGATPIVWTTIAYVKAGANGSYIVPPGLPYQFFRVVSENHVALP